MNFLPNRLTRGADKFLVRLGRKPANVSVRMACNSFKIDIHGVLICPKPTGTKQFNVSVTMASISFEPDLHGMLISP